MESQFLYHLYDDDEEEEEAADSDLDEPPNMQAALEQFRSEWQHELQQLTETPGGRTRKHSQGEPADQSCDEAQAKYLFVQGMQLEQNGQLYEAIRFYRKAIQLVPDIEFRIDMQPFTRKRRERQESESSIGSLDGSLDPDSENICELFRTMLTTEEHGFMLCQPEFQQQATHISQLPVEIMAYIFKWVVSSDIDLRSLEQLSTVCRGFYLVARDEGLWRLVCLKVFVTAIRSSGKYGSYRNLYLTKPHLNYNGCYISKSSYVRQGEKSIDSFYRPVHLVDYFRYLRFLPNGMCYMLTSPEEPYNIVTRLRDPDTKIQGILTGRYRVSGEHVSCILKRIKANENQTTSHRYRRNRPPTPDYVPDQTFHAEFKLNKSGKKKSARLVWSQYSVTSHYKDSGREVMTDFDLSDTHYPPLIFSCVRSYTALATKPLL